MKEFFSKTLFYIFGYLLEPRIEIWRFFFKFGRIMAIKIPKKHLSLPLWRYRILAFFNKKQWSKYGYWKYGKALDDF
jgi:hypothetical protein